MERANTMEQNNYPPLEEQSPQNTLQDPPQEEATLPAESGGTPADTDSWEGPAAKPARKDPTPLRLTSLLTFMFAALNALGGLSALIAWMGGQSFGSAGAMMLSVLLLPVGLLQALSGVMLLKYTKDPNDKLKGLCRNLGIGMLFVTVVYIVPYFMIYRSFALSLLPGPVIAVVYLAVLK